MKAKAQARVLGHEPGQLGRRERTDAARYKCNKIEGQVQSA